MIWSRLATRSCAALGKISASLDRPGHRLSTGQANDNQTTTIFLTGRRCTHLGFGEII